MLQRSDLRSFLNQVHFDDPVFVTFTLKQRLKDYGSLCLTSALMGQIWVN